MGYEIDGIPITAETIANTYSKYYPTQFAASSKYNFVNLFGIRVSTSDTSKLDDFVGAIKLSSGYTSLDGYEMLVCKASTEPSPLYIAKPFDYESKTKGGAAFLKEGQHIYYFISPRSAKPSWSDYGRNCAFCPTNAVPVYRFKPTQNDINLYYQNKKSNKPSISKNFEKNLIYANTAKKNNNAVPFLSTSGDTCIHKAWSETLYSDSAGCQVISPSDLPTFRNICNWAQQHLNKGYGNTFTYTLFTKQQFRTANIGSLDVLSGVFNFFSKLF